MQKQTKFYLNLCYIFLFLIISFIGINNSLGILSGEFRFPKFYTTLSGLLCFLYFLVAAIRGIIKLVTKNEEMTLFYKPRFKGAITICITVTMLVYHFLVYEGPIFSVDTDIYNLITHYIVPTMVILHYFLFDEKGLYHKTDPLIWTLIPLIYFGWANLKAAISTEPYWDGKWYPYSFIDINEKGVVTVMITVVCLLAFFLVLEYGLYAVDQKLKKTK